MNYESNYYSKKLKDVLLQRQRVNAGYSLRAFSRDIGMKPSTLSLVLNEKRPVPKKNIDTIVNCLELAPWEEALFRESISAKKSLLDNIVISEEFKNRYMLDDSNYKVLAEWEHYGIITLIETKDFESSVEYISKKLRISSERVEEVLQNLKTSGLIKVDENENFVLTQGALRTTEDISSKALRASHKETLDMGKEILDKVDVDKRDYSSMTIAVDPSKLPEAKSIIREFRQKMASLLKDGEKADVYQLAIQLYPLTNLEE